MNCLKSYDIQKIWGLMSKRTRWNV